MNNEVCNYVFKRGIKKGKTCNVINCSIHRHLKCNIPAPIQVLNTNTNTNNLDGIDKIIKKRLVIEDHNNIIKQKILELDTTNDNKAVIIKHFQNLRKLDSSTSEYYKNQIFIDHALSVPWNNYYNIHNRICDDESIKSFIDNIKNEFDKNIFGIDNVKNEIINYVCKFISNPNSQKNNIALYGSAGVCKTKFIKILSDVLGLPLKIISLAGAKDSSYFLGHNFTYVESNYGMVIQSIIDCKIMNPIMYFDELDKVSNSDNGKDIYSVLCNLTDPTVNSQFNDHYFRAMNFDLSKVFYVFTFNEIEKIDKVLLDRLNVIYVETPNKKDKCKILEKYCLKEVLINIGIKINIIFDQECFLHLVDYTNTIIDTKVSSGIRESTRILEKILLEINKEILCDILPNKSFNGISNELYVSYETYLKYFCKLKSQFLAKEITEAPPNMYM